MANDTSRPIGDSFRALREWTTSAQPASADEAPRLKEPLFLPEGARRYILFAEYAELHNRPLISFRMAGTKTQEPRFVLPVHFAILWTLELVPGLKMRMKAKTPSIFSVQLEFSNKMRRALKERPPLGSIMRVLFDAPPDAELNEIYKTDHHYILPQNYVLTKFHEKADALNRVSVLRLVRELCSIEPSSLPEEGLANLLSELFEISKRWHGVELCGYPE